MAKYTTSCEVSVNVNVTDTIHDETIFQHHLNNAIAIAVSHTISTGLVKYNDNTTVICGERFESYIDQYEYPYAEVDIEVDIVYYTTVKVCG